MNLKPREIQVLEIAPLRLKDTAKEGNSGPGATRSDNQSTAINVVIAAVRETKCCFSAYEFHFLRKRHIYPPASRIHFLEQLLQRRRFPRDIPVRREVLVQNRESDLQVLSWRTRLEVNCV